MEINVVPKFIDEAASPLAQAVGNTLSTIWDIGIGSHVSLWSKKQGVRQDQNLQNYIKDVGEKTQDIPEKFLKEPELHIVGPAIEASKYYIDSKELREMFANLIASSVDSRKSGITHPSFVEIIKQLSSDEAKLISLLDGKSPIPIIKLRVYSLDPTDITFAEPLINFSVFPYEAGCVHPDSGPSYLENIERLGLVNLSYSMYSTNDHAYDAVESHPIVTGWRKTVTNLGKRLEIQQGALTRTAFGQNFYESCVSTK